MFALFENTRLFVSLIMDVLKQVRNELESFREECKVLTEKLACSEENAEREKKSRYIL